MRKKMERLAKQLSTMYLTESPINLNDEDYGYKYFICFTNTHKIIRKTKNIQDMIEILEDIIENGAVDGNGTFY